MSGGLLLGVDAAAASGSFDPTTITGLQLWLKADSLSLTDGDPVGTWTDSSGNANNATGSGATRPTYKAAIVNGLPVVRFDGASETRLAFSTITVSSFTVFVVYSTSSFNTVNYLVAGTANGVFAGGGAVGGYGELDGSSNIRYATTQPTAIGLGTFQNTHLYRNGVEASYSSTGNLSGLVLTTVGARADLTSLAHSGDIAEILIYDSALGSTDRGNVEGYLISKYAL